MAWRLRRGTTDASIQKVEVTAYVIPTRTQPESDGTAEWRQTTLVLVELDAGGKRGLGYTYADLACARFIHEVLQPELTGHDALSIPGVMANLAAKVRNHGREGVAAMALSAVDVALWDLKARLLGVPLVRLLGSSRDAADVYGSGGFTSYTIDELRTQLGDWVEHGFRRVKMKVGRDAAKDPERVAAARAAIGAEVALFVDANGAWDRKCALHMAEVFAVHDVTWFEEPVSSDDLEGLRLLRDRAPAKVEITAGEYGYHPLYFRRMLEAGAVDVMMADATRCQGISGFLATAALCDAFGIPLSAHCAPALHLHPCLSVPRFRHLEYFFDHQRIEGLLFDGAPRPDRGALSADLTRPGLGLEFKHEDAKAYAV